MQALVRHASDRWLNSATIRGAALAAAGLVALAVPNLSARILGYLAAGAFLVIGVSELWNSLRARHTTTRRTVSAVGEIVAAAAIVLIPNATIAILGLVVGGLLALNGLIVLWGAVVAGERSATWLYDLVRGSFFIGAGALIMWIPEVLGSAMVLSLAFVAIGMGALLMSLGLTSPDEANAGAADVGGVVYRWFGLRDVGDEMREDVVDNLYFEPPDATQKQIGFWVLLVLSVVIATLGVLADSTAVVIGAMLVAPLMTPIMGISAAIVSGWVRRIGTSFSTVGGGVVVALVVAWIVAAWAPRFVPLASNSQILSRTAPTMIDLLIAVAAGAAGAYATVDKRVSSSITGVAIAVALVPPLGVAGIMFEAGEWSDGLGAFLLFSTNLVSIILVGSLVFFITGLSPVSRMGDHKEGVRTVFITVALGALIILVPLLFTSEGILTAASRQSKTEKVAQEWLSDSGLRLARVQIDGDQVDLQLAGEGTVPSVDELDAALDIALGIDAYVTVEYFPTRVFHSTDP